MDDNPINGGLLLVLLDHVQDHLTDGRVHDWE